jgi:glyoxylase-like metal-dependent hydrolase (beta-lactamase superfamily II)
MAIRTHKPVRLTDHLFQLGTPAFPSYLSVGNEAMLIEGGTGGTFQIMIDQIRSLGIDPGTIKYIVLTHTHPDHIGAVPHFQRVWPHIRLMTSRTGKGILARAESFKQFQLVDLGIAQLMKAKGEIDALPDPLKDFSFKVDSVIAEGEVIDLGAGIVWRAYDTPGHSPCHISLFEECEKTLALGDAGGFYVPEKGAFWPNYFESLAKYCGSIRKVAALPARRIALSHNGVIEKDVQGYLRRALEATENYHREIVGRIGQGEGRTRSPSKRPASSTA